MIFSNKTHIFLALVVIIIALVYLIAGLNATGRSTPVLPLDDGSIHFQHARVLAEGHPLQYDPGQPATSGATSLLYPAILAIGYLLGFQGQQLSWWAIGIGMVTWIGSSWLIYSICRHHEGESSAAKRSKIVPLVVTLSFVLTGSLGWAFMSGMETGLTVFLVLLTLWYVVRGDRRGVTIAAVLCALMRPEGLLIGVLAGS